MFYGMFECWNFPLSFLVSMYRSLRFPCPAASSAWLANSFTKLFLSFLRLAFTSLSAAAYSFCAFAFAFLVRLNPLRFNPGKTGIFFTPRKRSTGAKPGFFLPPANVQPGQNRDFFYPRKRSTRAKPGFYRPCRRAPVWRPKTV